jgi:WhiB family redox-sensing transcriptional regulator
VIDWADLLVGIPDLEGARCKGRADLFDATIGRRRVDDGPTRQELADAREATMRICNECPALGPCRAYVEYLRPSWRALGVVAGQVVVRS